MEVYNTYDFTVAHPDQFKQLTVKDMLFVFYKCPQVEKDLKLFTHFNEIVYTLCGKKTLRHGEKSWDLTDNSALFVRRTAYNQQLHHTIGWEVLAFYSRMIFYGRYSGSWVSICRSRRYRRRLQICLLK